MPINRHLQRSIKIDKSHAIISIEWYAFLDCQNLKSVTIPASVRTIGDISFGCYDYQKRKDGEGYIYRKMSDFVVYGKTSSATERFAR
ncbi:hypothetical protein E5329_16180 [Petralouisia muris]|uniref:Uncharacterized protein n=1 Tax=Petralouisia muris TaxID=3032872 RepID=A0AC61RUG1_9FIRM|nr:hypothetical protein E5329_16180 [Petralouisia muris]